MPSPEQLKEWHDVFSRIERVDDYQKLKKHLATVCERVEQLAESIKQFRPPRNPREDLGQNHDKVTHRMLQQQKSRLEEKLSVMAKQIEADIASSKNEL